MKTIRRIQLEKQHPHWELLKRDKDQDVPKEVFEKILKKFPQHRKYEDTIYLEGDPKDQNLIDFLNHVKEMGLKIPKDSTDMPFQVRISDTVHYENSDCDSSQFMSCSISKPLAHIENSDDVEIGFKIKIGSVKRIKKEYVHLDLPHLIGVRGKIKEVLESSDIIGLKLIKLSTTNDSWPDNIEPFYLIWSDVSLPPARTQLANQRPEKRSMEYMLQNPNEGYFLTDEYKVNPQLRYSSEQISKKKFDIACTTERFTEGRPYRHHLVYSKKFVNILTKHKVPISLKPIIIEK